MDEAHLPNTGRCKELLIDGAIVYLLPSDNPLKPEKKKEKPKYARKKDDQNIVIPPKGKEFRRDFKLTNV